MRRLFFIILAMGMCCLQPIYARADNLSTDLIFAREVIMGGFACPLGSDGNQIINPTAEIYDKPEINSKTTKLAVLQTASLQRGDWCSILFTQQVKLDENHSFLRVRTAPQKVNETPTWVWILQDFTGLAPTEPPRTILDLAINSAKEQTSDVTEFTQEIDNIPMQNILFRSATPRIYTNQHLSLLTTPASLMVASQASINNIENFKTNPPADKTINEDFSSKDGTTILIKAIETIGNRPYLHLGVYNAVHYEAADNEIKPIGFFVRDAWTPVYDDKGRINFWLAAAGE